MEGGYPSKWVNPSLRTKDKGNPTTRANLMRDYAQRVWKQLQS